MTKLMAFGCSVLAGFACGAAAVHVVSAQAKPPAYTIAEIEVTDPPTFQQYGQATAKSVPAAGGRGGSGGNGQVQGVEGQVLGR